MTADGAEWSEPTLVQVTEDEPTVAVPEAEPLPDAEHPPFPAPDASPEPAAETDPEQPEPAQPEPVSAEPAAAPPAAALPAARAPVTRRPRANYPVGESPPWRDKLIERIADVAVATMPIPLRVLDVGCGDGRLLSELILRVPYAELYVGLDPRPEAVSDEVRAREPRLSVVRGAAESMPLPDASFDLVLATLSLGVWLDQEAGAAELARVVSDNGKVIVVEAKKTQTSGRHRAHSVKDISRLLESAGLEIERIENVHRSPVGVSLAHAFIAFP